MYYPNIETIEELHLKTGDLIPVYSEIDCGMETPVTVYQKIGNTKYSFLLESIEGESKLARYSFIGSSPYKIIKTGKDEILGSIDPLPLIQEELKKFKQIAIPGLPRFVGGAVGFLSYELIHYFESRVKSHGADALNLPESIFMFTDTLVIFDHDRKKMIVLSLLQYDDNLPNNYQKCIKKINSLITKINSPLNKNKEKKLNLKQSKPVSNLSKSTYTKLVKAAKKYISDGDVIQVVLSQRIAKETFAKPLDIYTALRNINPSPYMYYFNFEEFQIIGASPEMLVRVEEGIVHTHPIAGTRPRGKNLTEDKALEVELLNDEKEKAEHLMLVDLGRNDIGKVSKTGTVQLPQFMEIERYSHVMHLVSHVQGEMRDDLNSFDAFRACFPAGTVSGAPKVRALEIISEFEPHIRGPYAGAVGYFSYSGNMDTAIAIRTIIISENTAYVQAGAGIVYDSIPEIEYEETIHKASALFKAIEKAEEGND